MKPWAEMTGTARAGVVGGIAALIAALLYGAWSVRGTAPAPAPVAEDAASGEAAAPEGAASADAAAEEPVAEEAAVPEAAPAEEAVAEEEVAETAAAAEEPAAAEAAPAEEVAAEAVPAEEAAAPAEEAAAVEPAAEAAAPAVVAPVPPSFDLVRVEKDGSALVAGKAEAASMLSLRVTGAEIAAVPADGQGNFVAMFNLAPSNAPRVLSLVMKLADGTEVPAEGSVVIAPTVAPEVVVAAAEPAATDASGTDGAGAADAAVEAAPVAEAAPAALLVTDEGAKVLQSADALPAELVANVTIDTITYTPEGAVQIAGRGTAERAVRIYLDNAQLGGDVAISTSGDWAVTLPEVVPGIYTLRADQVDETGKVTSRFETPFKRETVEALAAASGAAEEAAAATEAAAAEVAAAGSTGAAATETTEAGGTEAGAADGTATEGTATEGTAGASAALTVTVQPGFTLWKIATETLGEGIRYVQVFEANKDQIRDPDLIYPGQVFTIPQE